jgi:hypothetical protein
MRENDYNVIIGIDFGTAYSGYSYRRKGGKEAYYSKKFQNVYGDVKLPTVVLYDEKKEPVNWGNEAMKEYAAKRDKNYALIRYFKLDMLEICAKGSLERPKKIYQTRNGSNIEIDLVQAVAYVLRQIKNNAEDFCRESDVIISQDTIRWVITVPGNASEGYIHWIRVAAKDAGITSLVDDKHLMIGREPEVATLYAVYKDNENSKGIKINKKGNKILLLDCGGGTVDIGAYEIQECAPLKMKPLHHARAQNCGGVILNENFEDEILGKEFGRAADSEANEQQMITAGKGLITMIKSHAIAGEAWNKTLLEWEHITKREFDGEQIVPFTFQPSILSFLQKEHSNIYNGLVQNDIINQFYEPWNLMPEIICRKVFDPVINVIKHELHNIINKVGAKFDILIFVGGFSQSSYLRKSIRNEFKNNISQFIELPDASRAVVCGASAFGDNPEMLIGRILTCGYGVSVAKEYGLGPRDYKYKKVVADNTAYCTDRLDICLKRDLLCELGEELYLSSYHPIRKASKSVTFTIYKVEDEAALYIDDDGVKPLGSSFEVTLSEPGGTAELYCYFENNSELRFVARNGKGDEKKSNTLAFNWKWKE